MYNEDQRYRPLFKFNRISWEEIFNHPIMCETVSKIIIDEETKEEDQDQVTKSIIKNRQSIKHNVVTDFPVRAKPKIFQEK